MRYFLDTEFSERGPRFLIQLISIGIVAEDGREFYAISEDFNERHVSPWVRENVLPHLPLRPQFVNPMYHSPRERRESVAWYKRDRIAKDIVAFCDLNQHGTPEFWGYFCDYDWVVLCQLFGDMSSLPKGWPYYCRDLRQALDWEGLEDVKQPDDAIHNALADARWIAENWREHFGARQKS